MRMFLISDLIIFFTIFQNTISNAKLFDIKEFPEFRYINWDVNPCDDFYEFTCGNFKKFHPLQRDDELIDQFTILEKELAKIGRDILEKNFTAKAPQALRKARTAYHACINRDISDSIDIRNPEIKTVEKYGGFPILGRTPFDDDKLTKKKSSFTWYDIADISAEFGISIFLNPSLYSDFLNASRNLLLISTESLENPTQFRPSIGNYETAIEEGLLDIFNNTRKEDTLLFNRAEAETEKNILPMEILIRKIVLKLKHLLGSDRSDQLVFKKITDISDFLAGIYRGGYIPNGTIIYPISNVENSMTVTLKELNEWTVKSFGDSLQLDWVKYVKRLLQYTYVNVDENFLVLQPAYLNKTLYGILNWVKMNDEEIVKSAALLKTFLYSASDSDSETTNYFYDYLSSTGIKTYPRWEYCSKKIMDISGGLSLGLAVVYQYQLEYFERGRMEKISILIQNIRKTFQEIIEEAQWMDATSKKEAQLKADNIIELLGHPEFITDPYSLDHFYENLEITSWDHYSNAKRLRAFQQAFTLNMISSRNRNAWEKSPFNVNAYYNRQNNRIIFPIAMLNPIFFQGFFSSSILDYSRIGMITGHEITHGFDNEGKKYDPEGVIKIWWDSITQENFDNKTKCFIEQYSKYLIPEINANLSGSGSLNENLADNGGLRTAFRTFEKLLPIIIEEEYKNSSISKLFTPKQFFFIGYGSMWCNNESNSYLNFLVETCKTTPSCHARASMRVNGVVSNMKEFSEAFQCPQKSLMNPEVKCKLW